VPTVDAAVDRARRTAKKAGDLAGREHPAQDFMRVCFLAHCLKVTGVDGGWQPSARAPGAGRCELDGPPAPTRIANDPG
jgi:hypothetical protein